MLYIFELHYFFSFVMIFATEVGNRVGKIGANYGKQSPSENKIPWRFLS